MTTVFYRATTFLFVWIEFVKNGLGDFLIFFKGGGVLTIVFLFEQLSDNLNQKRLKTRGKS